MLRTAFEFVKANNIYINTLGEVSIYIVSSIPNPHAVSEVVVVVVVVVVVAVVVVVSSTSQPQQSSP